MIGMPPRSRDRPGLIAKPFHDLHLLLTGEMKTFLSEVNTGRTEDS